MNGFSSAQLRKLTSKLDRAHVHTRSVEGRQLDYIEGWFALSEANAIFGFDNWDRETVHFERLFERVRGDMTSCAYLARVRIRVWAGDRQILREGTGCGTGSARNGADAHDLAIKAAETDATKRALATFGNRFGLCLYDKEQAGVSEGTPPKLEILCPDGQLFADALSPEGFCTALRKLIESTTNAVALTAWRERNAKQIERLRQVAPDLKTQRGEHYAEVLERLFSVRMAAMSSNSYVQDELLNGVNNSSATSQPNEFDNQTLTKPSDLSPSADSPSPENEPHVSSAAMAPTIGGAVELSSTTLTASTAQQDEHEVSALAPSRVAYGPRIDKACLAIATVRRQRDKAHLRQVGSLPCVVCKSVPSHPHHLTFAQARGLALKVSDEYVVPLCVEHHNDLHRSAAERLWWTRQNIDPMPIAKELWRARLSTNLDSRLQQFSERAQHRDSFSK